MVKTYKITYWCRGFKKVLKLQATSKYNAKARFYLTHPADDIIRIEEVTEDV